MSGHGERTAVCTPRSEASEANLPARGSQTPSLQDREEQMSVVWAASCRAVLWWPQDTSTVGFGFRGANRLEVTLGWILSSTCFP